MAGKRRFIPDPPHVIARNMATAHLLRDPLYGGATRWDGQGEPGGHERWATQQQLWALNYRNFCTRPPLYSAAEIQEKAREFAGKFGVATLGSAQDDEALRQRFRTFLREEAVRLGLRERMIAKPRNPMSRSSKSRMAVIETLRKIEVAERAPERRKRLNAAKRKHMKERYDDPSDHYKTTLAKRMHIWRKKNPENSRVNVARFRKAHPEREAEYRRRAKLKKAMANALPS